VLTIQSHANKIKELASLLVEFFYFVYMARRPA